MKQGPEKLSAGLLAAWLCLAFAGRASAGESLLFVGNSFTFGAESRVQQFRPESVTDLNGDGVGGVPALFKAFATEAGLAYDVSLETASGMNFDFHYNEKSALLARAWDHVVLQGYSTLDAKSPGNPQKLVDYAARLAALFVQENPSVDVRLVATWSRADQTYAATGHWFGQPIDRMALDVRAACDLAAKKTPRIRSIIPVGEAWNRAMDVGLATVNPYVPVPAGQINLWAPDRYHASTEGYYLEALVIFGAVTKRDPRTLGAGESAARELGIAGPVAARLQQIASAQLAAGLPLRRAN